MKKVNLFLSSFVALAMMAACNNNEEATPETTDEAVEEVAPTEEVIEETESTEVEVETEVVETASAAKPATQTTTKSDKPVEAATDKTVNTSDSKTALQEVKEVVEESLDPNTKVQIQDGENRIKEKLERKKGK